MIAYADTNLFVRLYLRTPQHDEARTLVEQLGEKESESLPITWLHRIELVNALELSVFMGRQPERPHITSQQSAIALATFREDLSSATFLRRAVLVVNEMQERVEELALRHTARHGFRTYDLLHVASALLLGCDHFWSFDDRALALARLEGLKVASRKRR